MFVDVAHDHLRYRDKLSIVEDEHRKGTLTVLQLEGYRVQLMSKIPTFVL